MPIVSLPTAIVEPLIKHGFDKDDPYLWVLCKVNRRWRRYAHEILYKESKSIHTVAHRCQFMTWMKNPSISSLDGSLDDCQKKDDGAGKLSLKNIKRNSKKLMKQIFIKTFLSSYNNESSVVHVLSEDGNSAVACFKWTGGKYYDRYAQEGEEYQYLSDPRFQLSINGMHVATEYSFLGGYYGYVGLGFKDVVEHFPYLTPIEAFFVIYHAMSSDTRAICVATENFWWRYREDVAEDLRIIEKEMWRNKHDKEEASSSDEKEEDND